MQQSGIEGENVILILEDHLFSTSTLNLISILLSSGEVLNLKSKSIISKSQTFPPSGSRIIQPYRV